YSRHTDTTKIYPLSLHDALPISLPCNRPEPGLGAASRVRGIARHPPRQRPTRGWVGTALWSPRRPAPVCPRRSDRPPRPPRARVDRKSTRLNSSHVSISYAVFCL